jgi:exopolysaccharide biosynthesis operon protein EpsL
MMKISANSIETCQLVVTKNVFLLMLLTMVSTVANADPDGFFSPYVMGSYSYDSNFFRLQNDQAAMAKLGTSNMAESYFLLSAGANMNLHISRQLIKARAEVNQTRFNKYKVLNFDGYDGLLQWDWLIGSALSGDVGASEKTVQGSFVNIQQPINNLITVKQAFFHGGLQLGAPWKVKFGVEKNQTTNSLASQYTLDSTVDTYKTGLQYQTRKGSLLELTSQMSDGRYPNRQIVGLAPVDNGYKQWDNGIEATWEPTGKTKLQGHLNYTQRHYADVPQRDFSGFTGLLSANWQITDKTGLGLLFYRDIGVVENSTASYSVNLGVALSAAWKATDKTVFNLNIAQSRISYTGDPGFVLSTAPAREDKLSTVQAGVSYAVLRNTNLGVTLQRGVNQSNQDLLSYRFNSVMLNLRSAF